PGPTLVPYTTLFRSGERCWIAAAGPAVGWYEAERAMWPVLVVVPAVDAEHVLEMAAAEDEDPVGAVGANRAHPALGEGVRVRGRSEEHTSELQSRFD